MSDLPTDPTVLAGMTVVDHREHSAKVYGLLNALASGKVGSTLRKVTTGQTTESLGRAHPHYVFQEETQTITHDASGAVNIALASETRAVIVAASADITGWSITGWEWAGATFAAVKLVIAASSSVSVTWPSGSGQIVAGSPPTSLASGDAVGIEVWKWA